MAFGQITIQSLRQSHKELLERRQVRNFARQRAKVVAGPKIESPQVLHAEQLERQLRQTHAIKLTMSMCELSNMQIIDSHRPIQRRA